MRKLRREAKEKYRLAVGNSYYQVQEFHPFIKKWIIAQPIQTSPTYLIREEHVDELRRRYILKENIKKRYENKKPKETQWSRIY